MTERTRRLLAVGTIVVAGLVGGTGSAHAIPVCGSDADCDDGIACTVDTCAGGVCNHDPDHALCDDGNDCTFEVCIPSWGGCTTFELSGACEDGDPCTLGDQCVSGLCQPGAPLNCDDGNDCTADACTAGNCTYTPLDGASCDDGNLCTQGTCQGGTCLVTGVDCDDGDPCTVDGCDPQAGCTHEMVDCNDGDVCNGDEWCQSGPMVGRVVINEIMQNPSSVPDSQGEWFELFNGTDQPVDIDGWTIRDDDTDLHVIDNGGPLVIPPGGYIVLGNNGDANTNGGILVDYVYDHFVLANGADEVVLVDTAGNIVDYVAYDGGPAFPDPNGASMELIHPGLDNALGSSWAVSTNFVAGHDGGTPGFENSQDTPVAVCMPGTPLDCDDGVACTVDACDPATGCTNTPDDAACDDGVGCTVDTCDATADCQFTPDDAACDDGVGCTGDTCDATADCQHTADDAACDDGVGCTVDTCDATADCQHAADDAACDDGVGCTVDTCDPMKDCQHAADDASCDDGVGCTVDACDPLQDCQHVADDASCDDGVGCTVDTCDSIQDCQHAADDASCDDGVGCTVDTCDPMQDCQHAADDASCDDGVGCTVDTCDAMADCQFTPDDAACDDSVDCTADTCDAMADCQHAPQDAACDDGVGCTVDSCDPSAGCIFGPDDAACDDGIDCTVDSCDATFDCQHLADATACDDGVDCTVDSCDPASGCTSTPSDVLCEDGIGCTVDTCDPQAGCVSEADDTLCDDGSICTSDACDPQAGCTHGANALGDITDPGAVNVVDVQCHLLAVVAVAAGAPLPECLAVPLDELDYNCDGLVNVTDSLILVFRAISGSFQPGIDSDGNLCPDACEPVYCGDGVCNGDEACFNCPEDCACQPVAYEVDALSLPDPHLYWRLHGCFDVSELLSALGHAHVLDLLSGDPCANLPPEVLDFLDDHLFPAFDPAVLDPVVAALQAQAPALGNFVGKIVGAIDGTFGAGTTANLVGALHDALSASWAAKLQSLLDFVGTDYAKLFDPQILQPLRDSLVDAWSKGVCAALATDPCSVLGADLCAQVQQQDPTLKEAVLGALANNGTLPRLVLVLQPDPNTGQLALEVHLANCAGTTCSPSQMDFANPISLPAVNVPLGSCYLADPATLTPGYSTPNAPQGPCVAADTGAISFKLAGKQLVLPAGSVAAHYGGSQPGLQLDDGVFAVFLPASEAAKVTIPASVPVYGGRGLDDLFVGGSQGADCPGDDADMYGGEEGWWLYFNFRAKRVDWTP